MVCHELMMCKQDLTIQFEKFLHGYSFKQKCVMLPGWDGSWTGDYATCGSCHLAARITLAPHLLQGLIGLYAVLG